MTSVQEFGSFCDPEATSDGVYGAEVLPRHRSR